MEQTDSMQYHIPVLYVTCVFTCAPYVHVSVFELLNLLNPSNKLNIPWLAVLTRWSFSLANDPSYCLTVQILCSLLLIETLKYLYMYTETKLNIIVADGMQ